MQKKKKEKKIDKWSLLLLQLQMKQADPIVQQYNTHGSQTIYVVTLQYNKWIKAKKKKKKRVFLRCTC